VGKYIDLRPPAFYTAARLSSRMELLP